MVPSLHSLHLALFLGVNFTSIAHKESKKALNVPPDGILNGWLIRPLFIPQRLSDGPPKEPNDKSVIGLHDWMLFGALD